MRHWDLDTSTTQLRRALDDLQLAWNTVSESWHDSVSRQFAEQYLDPLVPAAKMTLDAASLMRDTLLRVREDCEK